MTLAKQEIDVARKVKAIEYLKAQLVGNGAQVFFSLLEGEEQRDPRLPCGFNAYWLHPGQTLRCGFCAAGQAALAKAREHAQSRGELEKWYGDYSSLVRYLLEPQRADRRGENTLKVRSITRGALLAALTVVMALIGTLPMGGLILLFLPLPLIIPHLRAWSEKRCSRSCGGSYSAGLFGSSLSGLDSFPFRWVSWDCDGQRHARGRASLAPVWAGSFGWCCWPLFHVAFV